MENREYNGWTNWDTWCANLWMTNEPDWQAELEASRSLEDVRKVWDEVEMFCLDSVDVERVNWEEILAHVLEWRLVEA